MKHRFTIPFIERDDSSIPDISGWAHRFGWHVNRLEATPLGIIRGGAQPAWLRITLAPWAQQKPFAMAEIEATSGATLIFDDVEKSMAVTLERVPEQDPPVEPKDEIPVLYKPGDTVHIAGQPPEALGKVVSLDPERVRGEPVYSLLVYGGRGVSRRYPAPWAVVQSQIEPAESPV